MKHIGYGIFINGRMIAFYEDKGKCFTPNGKILPVYILENEGVENE